MMPRVQTVIDLLTKLERSYIASSSPGAAPSTDLRHGTRRDLDYLAAAREGLSNPSTREEALNELWRDLQHSDHILTGVGFPDQREFYAHVHALFLATLEAVTDYRRPLTTP